MMDITPVAVALIGLMIQMLFIFLALNRIALELEKIASTSARGRGD